VNEGHYKESAEYKKRLMVAYTYSYASAPFLLRKCGESPRWEGDAEK